MMHSHLLTIQQYAIKYKLSTFTVIKQVNSGKLKTIKKVIDGEEKEFIVDETVVVSEERKTDGISTAPIDYKTEYEQLLHAYNELREKYIKLLELHTHAPK